MGPRFLFLQRPQWLIPILNRFKFLSTLREGRFASTDAVYFGVCGGHSANVSLKKV